MSYFVPGSEFGPFLEIFGTFSGSLPEPTAYIKEATIVVPNVALTLPEPAGSFSLTMYNDFSGTLPTLTSAFELYEIAKLHPSLPKITSAGFTATLGTTATITAALPTPTVTLSGGVFSLDARLPKSRTSFNALNGSALGFEFSLPKLTTSFTGLVGRIAPLTPSLQALRAGFTATLVHTVDATGDSTTSGMPLPTLRAGFTAHVGVVGVVTTTLPLTRMAFASAVVNEATLDARLHRLRGRLTPPKPASNYLMAQVTNTNTTAVTTFAAYQYNSMARFNGMYLAAGPTGLVELDDESSLEDVVGTITTGQLDFGTEQQKRCSDFYLAMRSEGDVKLRVTTDELDPYEYTVSPQGVDRIKQRRSPIGKGAKGKYWTFELECSSAFDYDTMNIAAVPVSRRL